MDTYMSTNLYDFMHHTDELYGVHWLAGEDWAAFGSRHKQAASDSELFARAVSQAISYHEREIEQVWARGMKGVRGSTIYLFC